MNSFIGVNITTDCTSNAHVYDITSCPNTAVINLPTLGMQSGTTSFDIQVVGTFTNATSTKYGSSWMYTSNGSGSAIGVSVAPNTTYLLTYYATAGNPLGTNCPSYTMVAQ